MARVRDPNRNKAFEIYEKHGGKIDLVEIASQLNISPGTIRGWKSKDSWDIQLNGTLRKNMERSKRRKGGQPGNKNAEGHGGNGPPGNKNAVKTGEFEALFFDTLDSDEQKLIQVVQPDKEVENCLKKIRQSSEYLMTLINDVLDISHIESGKLEYKPVPVDLRDMLNTVLSIARGYIENRDLNLYVSREELKTPYVMADELRIREVLLNIISNAIKFTKDGGTISFVAENCPCNDEHHVIVRYRISDTGIGMSEEFLGRIFDEFSQENDGARTSYKGTGLGMAIAKKYVDLMGGKIEVSSRQNIGSTFTVEIPLLIAEHVETEEKEKLKKDMDLHGLHVLLAEDNDLNAEIAIALLEEQGMIVTRAVDGKSALTQFCNTDPGTFDLILMDIMMPEMNGYETTKAIRNLSNRPDGKKIPIIAMTANAFAEDVQAALNAGMDDHVAKPVDMEILTSVITKYIER